jgi:hypothetical protein
MGPGGDSNPRSVSFSGEKKATLQTMSHSEDFGTALTAEELISQLSTPLPLTSQGTISQNSVSAENFSDKVSFVLKVWTSSNKTTNS